MGRLTVYVPDEMERRFRESGISPSALFQKALEFELLNRENRSERSMRDELLGQRVRKLVEDEVN